MALGKWLQIGEATARIAPHQSLNVCLNEFTIQ